MKNKLIIIFLLIQVSAFAQTDKLLIRLERAIEISFQSDRTSLQEIDLKNISTDLSKMMHKDRIYKIYDDEKFKGFAYVGIAPSKERDFDYLLIFDSDLEITEAKVLAYRESHGREITTKRWLQQFVGKSPDSSKMKLGKDIDAISGATISARSMTIAVNKALQNVGKLRAKQIL